MAEPFLAEIRIVGFNFAPRGWATCDGQILPINQNQSLYSLLGTTYGGDGRTSFALPDLRGRVPIHTDASYRLGQKSGEETHTLTTAEIPSHQHQLQGVSDNADSPAGTGGFPARTTDSIYGPPQNLMAAAAGVVPNVGGGQSHDNMMPTLVLNFVIALQGLFPSRN